MSVSRKTSRTMEYQGDGEESSTGHEPCVPCVPFILKVSMILTLAPAPTGKATHREGAWVLAAHLQDISRAHFCVQPSTSLNLPYYQNHLQNFGKVHRSDPHPQRWGFCRAGLRPISKAQCSRGVPCISPTCCQDPSPQYLHSPCNVSAPCFRRPRLHHFSNTLCPSIPQHLEQCFFFFNITDMKCTNVW